MKVNVCKGKYTVVINDDGELRALRYGEDCRCCTGDNLIYNLAMELQEARDKLSKIQSSVYLTEKWSLDQTTALGEGLLSLATMKCIRMYLRG